jgi:hypothetical protein
MTIANIMEVFVHILEDTSRGRAVVMRHMQNNVCSV